MSNLSVHENRSNSNYSYPRSNRPYYQQTRVAQAELTAFTQPLMSIEFPYSPTSYQPRNYYSRKPHMQNQQTNVPTTTTTTIQPAYYVDSFQSNFSDKSSSNTQNDNNSNTKTKVKHVTFEEPEQVKYELLIVY